MFDIQLYLPLLLNNGQLIICFNSQVVGLDLVDDESKPERRPTKHMPTPVQWTNVFNPAFSYYVYYCYANLYTLNKVPVMLQKQKQYFILNSCLACFAMIFPFLVMISSVSNKKSNSRFLHFDVMI